MRNGCANLTCLNFIRFSMVTWKWWKKPNGWTRWARLCNRNYCDPSCPAQSNVIRLPVKRFQLQNNSIWNVYQVIFEWQFKVKGGHNELVEPRMDISFWNLVPCYSTHTEPGLCLSTAICAAIGGTPSGSCMYRMSMSKTCCIINSNH